MKMDESYELKCKLDKEAAQKVKKLMSIIDVECENRLYLQDKWNIVFN